ncbi:carbohydrate-binding protein, partial [Streptomyces sp. MCAF7]
KVVLETPKDGQLFSFGDAIPFKVKVTDPEDGRTIDCDKVKVTLILGHDTAQGAKAVGDIDNGDWIAFKPYVLSDATKITARVASAGAGGTLEIRAGSATGTLLGKATVPVTGGWETYQDVSADLSRAPSGTTDQDGDTLTYSWDFGDGGTSTAANPAHKYSKNGTYTATVTAK